MENKRICHEENKRICNVELSTTDPQGGNEVLRIGRRDNPINEPQDLLQDEKN